MRFQINEAIEASNNLENPKILRNNKIVQANAQLSHAQASERRKNYD